MAATVQKRYARLRLRYLAPRGRTVVVLRLASSNDPERTQILRRPDADSTVPPHVQATYREIFGSELTLRQAAVHIVEAVRSGGDAAARRLVHAFGDAPPSAWRVDTAELEAAPQQVPAPLREALERAAANIRAYHQHQRRPGYVDTSSGAMLGQLVRPIESVAIYAPGGLAAYPSSVLMGLIPAKVAGCRRVVLASPLRQEPLQRATMLAAARIAGADDVFQIGGAVAIAALAYGTETIPAVDKIVGPGNAIVVLAMREVFGQVGIGSLPGPSEALIIANDSAPAAFVAADLLSQPEHGPNGITVLLTTSRTYALAVDVEMERQCGLLPRQDIIRAAFANAGGALVVGSLEEALTIANDFAPEHLQLCFDGASEWLPKVQHAGAVFLGPYTPVPLGDYAAGTNHILPVLRMARFSSPLGVDDFVKRTSLLQFGPGELRALAPVVTVLAGAEGFQAHAEAINIRLRHLDGSEGRVG